MKAIIRIIDQLNEFTGRAVAWLTTALVLLYCYDVFMRYVFKVSRVWIGELEWHLFALIFLVGAAYAFKHDRHVRVDVFYTRFSAKGKAVVNLVGILLFLIPWCLVVMTTASRYALNSWTIGEGSPNPGGLPAWYMIKFAIVLGAFLLLLQALAEAGKAVLVLLNQPVNAKN